MRPTVTGAQPTAREAQLVAGISRIRQSLEAALRDLRIDQVLARVAGADLPDAASRLDYVVQLTEDAANRTLDLVDQARDLNERMRSATRSARQREHLEAMAALLSEMALAQAYQDLTGQIIHRVVGMVRGTEEALVALLQAAGVDPASAPQAWDGAANGPAVTTADAGVSQNDADDLLAGLGL